MYAGILGLIFRESEPEYPGTDEYSRSPSENRNMLTRSLIKKGPFVQQLSNPLLRRGYYSQQISGPELKLKSF